MRLPALLLMLALLVPALAGCAEPTDTNGDAGNGTAPADGSDAGAGNDTRAADDGTAAGNDTTAPAGSYQAMGFDGENWPRLDGVTITIIDHGAFGYAFPEAKAAFEALTGATVEQVEANDAGSAINRAAQEAGNPTFDVIYAVDNAYYPRAVELGIFEPYQPLLADRIPDEFVFFGRDSTWYATPVDHGYIALNVDSQHEALQGVNVSTLEDVRNHANLFVTQDPRTSSPGLGFLLSTIAAFPEGADYTWKDYWTDLFENGVTVTSGWSEAYANRFTRGYGSADGQADKPIVTSYTTSPAYERYYETFGTDMSAYADVLLAPDSVFHQIQTMGIVKGTSNLAAAQAWIEFTLTDDFQKLAAEYNAIYPVVPSIDVSGVYGDNAPAPGTFDAAVADLNQEQIAANLQTWIGDWVDLCEAHDCA